MTLPRVFGLSLPASKDKNFKAGFGKHFDEVKLTEADLNQAMCVVWYAEKNGGR